MIHFCGSVFRVSLAFSLLLGLALGVGGATADEPAEAGSGDAAKLEAQCAEEAGRLCPDLEPGRPFVVRCLLTHSTELSPTCTAYLKHVWQRAEVRFDGLKGACSDELEQHCPQSDERLGEAVRCLRRVRDQLSEGCEAELSRPPDSGADSQPKSREGDGPDRPGTEFDPE
jgi:hypothetical protein